MTTWKMKIFFYIFEEKIFFFILFCNKLNYSQISIIVVKSQFNRIEESEERYTFIVITFFFWKRLAKGYHKVFFSNLYDRRRSHAGFVPYRECVITLVSACRNGGVKVFIIADCSTVAQLRFFLFSFSLCNSPKIIHARMWKIEK